MSPCSTGTKARRVTGHLTLFDGPFCVVVARQDILQLEEPSHEFRNSFRKLVSLFGPKTSLDQRHVNDVGADLALVLR